jgi:hypothetical protein
MHIQDLLEYTSTKPIIAYHTTLRKHLRPILKHGLVPNKSEGGYGSDEKSSAGYSLKSLPGTYFYREYKKAKNLANTLNAKNNTESMIIICQIQPKTATVDEDRLDDYTVFDEIDFTKVAKQAIKSGKADGLVDYGIRLYLDNLIKTTDANGKRLDSRIIDNVTPDITSYINALVEFIKTRSPESESAIKYNKNIISKKLRSFVTTQPKFNFSFKVNEPITFSGANRIVGIYLPKESVGWGELGDFAPDAYNVYDTPMELSPKSD